ncbi:MAG: tetratricopeptide repeat protein [bacterium]|nr:tetratricopeptide repeat protein [bacterium]
MIRERWLLAAILVVGALLRLTYLLEISRAPDFDNPQFEAQYHDYWARALVTGDWTPPVGVTDPEIPERPYFRPPGYPFFLSGVYRVTGPGYFWPRIAQMALGLLSCWLLFRLARRAYGGATALFATALAATSWIFVFFEGELMAVALLVFLLLATLTVVASWREAFTLRRAAGAGVLLGLAALVRPNAAILLPAFLLWVLWWLWRREGRPAWIAKVFLRPALAFVAAFAFTTAPATLRNLAVAGDPVWITSNAGVNLFIGTHPDSDGTRPGVAELGEIAGLDRGWDSFDYPLVAAGVERAEGRALADSEVSSYFTRRALRYVASEPGTVARLTLRKLALFWGPAEVSNNKVIHFERAASPTLRLGPGFATVLALAIAGAVLLLWGARLEQQAPTDSRRIEITVLLLLFAAAYSASYLPFFVSARFRAPLIPILLVFAGHALARLWNAVEARRYRLLALGLGLILALRVVTGIAWVPYEPDQSLWHWRKGLLWKARGEADRAQAEFRAAAEADPGDFEARLSLAESLAATGLLDEAIAEYRAALSLDPSSITTHNNLARILAGRGDLDAAIRHWSAALDLDPERVSVLNNLAYALATHPDPELRDPDRAVELAERGVELGGPDPRLRATLAVAYRAAGRTADAEELSRRYGASPTADDQAERSPDSKPSS